ncbi:MAG: hypothetical protein QOF32_1796 [Gammaproteobacteria bacterium]|jgi:hypothetical protein|nr:hypothetical protein [Gammaproteobacteria bacterium]
MSWSFRSPSPGERITPNRYSRLLCATIMMVETPAFAAEWYVQPTASLTVESDSNLELDPGMKQHTEGYLANVSTLAGIATATSEYTIRPRFEYREYPQSPQDNRLEEYLDFTARSSWVRSNASVYGNLEHRDEFNAEFSSALYDQFNPAPPTAPETGKAVAGATRDSAILIPSYNYKFTPILGAGVSGIYQKLNYAPNDATSHVDFDYYLGKAYLTWSLNQKSELSAGAFGSKYQATRIDSRATGTGATMDLDTKWTQLLSTTLSVVYQRTSVDMTVPTTLNSVANAWGATFSAVYKTQVSQYRLNLGRLITPSGGGALYVADQLRSEYDRDLTERLSFTGAVIALRNRGLTANVVGDDRTYAQTVVELKWMMAPTWFLQGGYQYMWQKYQLDPTSAANNRVYIRVGYQGLGVQRR